MSENEDCAVSYDIADEPLIIHPSLMQKILKTDNPADNIALYMFYYYTAKRQSTNQPYCNVRFIANGLQWSEKRVRTARESLKELGLIEDIQRKDELGKITKCFVKVRFIWGKAKSDEIGQNSHTNDSHHGGEPHSGDFTTNALSLSNINALSLSKEMLSFDEFRKIYPGKKRGNLTEFTDFKKKHKDWKDVLPELLPAIESQIRNKEDREKAKQFVPEWKNLRTWLNQRCWEEEIAAPIEKCYSGYEDF